MIPRLTDHLLLTPRQVTSSDPSVRVVGVFNPAAIDAGDEVLILARVAEAPAEIRTGYVGLPRWRRDGGGVEIQWAEHERVRMIDPRLVELRSEGVVRLTFTSHLRLYRFTRDLKPLSPPEGEARMTPLGPWEVFGVEDPRITLLDGWMYITYVAASPHGACTALARTRDFRSVERLGVMFPPENKDVVIFPEKIGGRYVALHRPNPHMHFTRPEVWIGYSDNLVDWGGHEPLLIPNTASWQTGRIGGGAVPIRTDDGWLVVYHGNDRIPGMPEHLVGSYFGAALLLDLDDPRKVVAHAAEPILFPQQPYETHGFVQNVVFPTAVLDRGDAWLIIYGAADENVAAAQVAKARLRDAIIGTYDNSGAPENAPEKSPPPAGRL